MLKKERGRRFDVHGSQVKDAGESPTRFGWTTSPWVHTKSTSPKIEREGMTARRACSSCCGRALKTTSLLASARCTTAHLSNPFQSGSHTPPKLSKTAIPCLLASRTSLLKFLSSALGALCNPSTMVLSP